MMIKKWFILLLLFFSLYSCDYWGSYEFHVTNNTEDSIKVDYITSDISGFVENGSFVIKSNQSKVLLKTISEQINPHDGPSGIYNDSISVFKSILISDFKGDTINSNLKKSNYWTYTKKNKSVGLYNLEINSLE